ncbi:MAG TPA: hypothetical protein VEG68_10750 [Terriglobales bacterium]|nr:hypothetical protein [Terriglobales bacterium]
MATTDKLDLEAQLEWVLAAKRTEQESHDKRMAAFEKIETGIRALMGRGEAGSTVTPTVVESGNGGSGNTPLARLILKIAHDAGGHWLGLEDFKRAAEHAQFDFGEKSPGRTLHWGLIGLTTNGYLESQGSDSNRRYRAKQ